MLSFVEDSGCTFIRNGSEYPAAGSAPTCRRSSLPGAQGPGSPAARTSSSAPRPRAASAQALPEVPARDAHQPTG
ncbi:hypothetical protein P4234_13850 [Pseudomonas aeruginosa]|nr:hypothetical protein [Pseudomonas aeruginosa]